MNKARKILKKGSMVLGILLIFLQVIRPTKNESNAPSNEKISDEFAVPAEVVNILDQSCNDCHSDNTYYPWYAGIQPVAWWLQDHINEGKEHLNFDHFKSYSPEDQFECMEELVETVQEGEMPMPSYTWMHSKAILTQSQKTELKNWAEGIRSQLLLSHPGLEEEGGESHENSHD